MADQTSPKLNCAWQTKLNEMVTGGMAYEDVAESMFMVAVAAKLQIDGSFELARSLYVLGMAIAQIDKKPQHLH